MRLARSAPDSEHPKRPNGDHRAHTLVMVENQPDFRIALPIWNFCLTME
jgi:hypothetical protein